MALDTPLIRDGSLHTAFANLYNPTVALAGPGGSGQFLAVFFQASRVLQIQTTLGGAMYGVLQNTPMATEACDVGIIGISKAVAGGTIAFGAELEVDTSGRFITWASGSAKIKVGMAMEAAVLNQVFSMMIYTPNIVALT